MRGIRTAGCGLAAALTAQAAWADAPAARIGKIQAAGAVARAQAADVPRTDPAPRPAPSVTELRGGAAPAPAAPLFAAPAPTFGSTAPVVIGQPYAVGPGAVPPAPVFVGGPPAVGYGQPVYGSGPVAFPASAAPVLDAPLFGAPYAVPTAGATGILAGGGGVGLLAPGGGPAGRGRFTFHADYLMWWVKNNPAPPLVTTSSPQFNGILGRGDTRTLLGDETLTDNPLHGGRFGGVFWLTPRFNWGIDWSVFFLGRNGSSDLFTTQQDALLARPFVNLNSGQSFSELVAAPGLATGAVAVNASVAVSGGHVDLRRPLLACNPCQSLDLLVGFRTMRLSEDLQITESFASVPTQIANGAPSFGTVTDKFTTTNRFYGPEVGLAGELRRGRFVLGGRASVALGTVFQTSQIDGSQIFQTGAGPAIAPGGLLALPGNIGRFGQTKFGVLPEVGLTLGYQVTPQWRLSVGYNFMYLNSVLRPADQIDTGLDVTRIPNFPLQPQPSPLSVVRPAPLLRESDFFTQGLTFSVQYEW